MSHASAQREPTLAASGLTRSFTMGAGLWNRGGRCVAVVEGVDIQIRPGETYALVGESGSGKSTTARLMLLLDEPSDGIVSFHGKDARSFDADELRAYRRRVQAVFQDPYGSLNPRRDIGRAVAEPLEMLGQGRSADAVRERVVGALESVGLGASYTSAFPRELSGGQRQRVAIARAISTEPECIVLDEPVSGLDASIQAAVINLLLDLQDRLGVGYLFISHDLAVVRQISTEVGVMYLGRVVEHATRDELYANPLHPYTRSLMAAARLTDAGRAAADDVAPGEPASVLERPSGCAFHPRCPFAHERCRAETPALREAGDGHTVACHLY